MTVRFGRVGGRGQTRVTELGSELAALSHLKKLIAEKLAKGYREVAATSTRPAPPSTPADPVPPVSTAPTAPAPSVSAASTAPVAAAVSSGEHPRWWNGSGEDRLDVPAEWRAALRPRRGGLAGPPVAADPAAAEDWRADLLAAGADLHGLRTAGGDPRLIAAGLAALDGLAGRPEPLGLAVLGALLLAGRQANPARIADGWFTGYGAGIAAAATAELGRISLHWDLVTVSLRPRRGSDHLRDWPAAAVAHRMRALLAAAPGADYANATTALATVRDAERSVGTGLQRVLASYLVPTRADWVDELCAETAAAGAPDEVGSLLLCALSTPAQLRVLDGARSLYWPLGRPDVRASLIDGLGPAVAPLLARAADQDPDAGERRRALLGTLALLPTDEAFRLLAERLHRKDVGSAVAAAAARFPVRALRVLTAVAEGDGPAAAASREQRAAHLRAHPELGADREISPDAPAGGLPAVLVTPPWTRRTARPVVVPGLAAGEPAAVHWQPGERDEWAAGPLSRPERWWNANWDAEAADLRRGALHPLDGLEFLALAPEELARPLLTAWRGGSTDYEMLPAGRRVVARFGVAALPLAVEFARSALVAGLPALLLPFTAPEVAGRFAEWLVSAKSVRPLALCWLDRHRAAAARLLVPAALGKAGPARRQAESALRVLADRGAAAELRAAAAGYGADAEAGVRALLDTDPLDRLPTRLPTVPDWADPAVLPQLLLAGGERALPGYATGHLITMLALSTPDYCYAGIPVVLRELDPVSTRDFGWALFQAWLTAGAPSKECGSVFAALGRLGDDETVRRLTPLLRAWPGDSAHARAVAGLDVLALVGTDSALVQLDGIARTVKFRGLRARAQQKIADIAADRGLTADQLADRLVPDFGLTSAAAWQLDHGARRFTIGLDYRGVPFVTGPDGKRKAGPPKPAATDDPARAAAARYGELKKALRPVAALQLRRLDDALATQRGWAWSELRDLLLPHPLLGVLARGLVWQAAAGAFRPAEDGTPTAVDGTPVPLADTDEVRLAHPALTPLDAWAPVFAGQQQPIPQLDRPVHRLSEAERTAVELTRFHGLAASVGKAIGLSRRGWQRARPEDGGIEPWLARPVPGGRAVVLVLDPGITAGDPTAPDRQRVASVRLLAWPLTGWTGRPDTPFGLLDPVAAAEVLTDLTDLTS